MSFAEDIGSAIRSATCFYLAGVDNANSWLQERVRPLPLTSKYPAGLRGLLCDDPTPPPESPPQFTGGQCPGVEYFVYINANGVVSETPCCATGPENRRYVGPIGPLRAIPNTFNTERWVFDHAGGTQSAGVTSTTNPQTWSIDRVERADGQPDVCGDPLRPVPPFVPPVITRPVPSPTGGPDIDVDVTVYAPVAVGGVIFAPVSVRGPNFEVDGRIVLSPNVAVEVGLGGTGGGGGGSSVSPDSEDDFDPESESEPPEADGRKIIGLIVNLSFGAEARATELAQDGDLSSIGVPRVAIAYLVSNNGGVRVPLPGIDLKSRSTYIPVPFQTEVVSWRIHTEPGVSVRRVRPVWGTTQPSDA